MMLWLRLLRAPKLLRATFVVGSSVVVGWTSCNVVCPPFEIKLSVVFTGCRAKTCPFTVIVCGVTAADVAVDGGVTG